MTLKVVLHDGHIALVLPPEMAERLRWVAGDRVEAEIVGDGLMVRRVEPLQEPKA